MASKGKTEQEGQKAYWQRKLSQRIEVLTGMGIDAVQIEKDTTVKKIRAKIRDTVNRLRAIDSKEKQIEEMARLREEKKAAPPKEKSKKDKAAEKAAAEAKPKKKKKKEDAGDQPAEAKKAAVTEEAKQPETKPEEEKKAVKKAKKEAEQTPEA